VLVRLKLITHSGAGINTYGDFGAMPRLGCIVNVANFAEAGVAEGRCNPDLIVASIDMEFDERHDRFLPSILLDDRHNRQATRRQELQAAAEDYDWPAGAVDAAVIACDFVELRPRRKRRRPVSPK